MITIVVKNVGQAPKVATIKESMNNYKDIVGGYLEAVHVQNDLMMIVNEEGLLNELPLNFQTVRGPIVGNVFFVGTDGEDFTSISKEMVDYVFSMFDEGQSEHGMTDDEFKNLLKNETNKNKIIEVILKQPTDWDVKRLTHLMESK